MSNFVHRTVSVCLALLLAAPLTSESFLVGKASAEDAEGELWSYPVAYTENVASVCSKWNPKEGSVINMKEIAYPEIGNANADAIYRKDIKDMGGDASGLEAIIAKGSGNGFEFGSDLLKASEVYKERMNGVFACAQINFKIRTNEQLLKTIKGAKAGDGNTAKKVEEQAKMLRSEMKNRHCADRTSTEGKPNIMMKSQVLVQSTYEYCNYRHYVQYLRDNAQNRLSKFIEAEDTRRKDKAASPDSAASSPTSTSEEMGVKVGNFVVSIDQEIAHTREVFPQAMVAYTEFERTYASHVVMLFVLEDYSLLRDSLKKVMNPLGQSIYKASNAESPFSP